MKRSLGRWLIRMLAPDEIRHALLDDLDEALERRTAAVGARAARRWYRRQVLSSFRPLVAMRLRRPPSGRHSEPGATTMDTFLQDLRYAVRLLRRSPGVAVAAIATTALGIGMNTAIFSVVHGLLLKPLPYPDPDRVVTLWQDLRSRGGPPDEWATPGNFADWRASRSTFASMASVRGWRPTLTGQGDPEPLAGELVTQEYFDVLGVAPAIGRFFRPDEMMPKAPRVVVISHGMWMRRFAGQADVLGRQLLLGGEPHEVVGVLPAGFRPFIVLGADVWRPDQLNLATPSRGAVVLRVVARLQPGVAIDRARASMAALAAELERRYPDFNAGVGFSVIPLHERVVGNVRPGLLVLLGAVLLVLLVACVNIANLLLARASGRTREMAVRAALGAGRRRVVRQLLTESVLLASVGGAIGVALGFWGARALVAIAPAGTPRLNDVGLNPWVLAMAALLTLCTGVLFGLAPALQASRREHTTALKDGGRGSTGGSGQRARRALIVAEVAVALVLLVGSGLLLRSFIALQRSDLGFNPSQLLAGFVPVPAAKYRTDGSRVAFQDRLLERLSGLPGVERAALSSVVPFDAGDSDMDFLVEGMAPAQAGDRPPVTWYRLVSSDYFATLEIPLREGRGFNGREAAPVVVVNATLAGRYFPGASAVGRRIRFRPDGPWFTIVGVAGDVRQQGARGGERAQTFIPYWQFPELAGGTSFALRTAVAPELVTPALARAVKDVDPEVPVARLVPMSQLVFDSIEEPRFLARITALFAALAMLLAALGVYGVTSYAVTQRLPEIGVRLALGARRRDVFRLVFGSGLRLAAFGVAFGAGAALLLGPALRTLLFEVAPADPLTFAFTAAGLLLVAAMATLIPARRATRVDPVTALREN